MREKNIESRLVAEVRRRGGLAPNFVSPGLNGVPDRLLLLPGGKFAFAELKAPGPLQALRKRQLEKLGFRVFVIDDTEKIGGGLDAICAP